MNTEEFEQLVRLNSELRSVEFKSPGDIKDDKLLKKVIKASLGLSSIRGGGYIVIGIVEDKINRQLEFKGLTDEQAKSWSYDGLGDQISLYADPYVNFHPPETVSYQGNTFVVIRINEFEEVPILCKKDAQELKQGYCYVRTRRKPETISIPTQTEMRELLELAVIKGVKKYLSQTASLGIDIKQITQQLNPDFNSSTIAKLRDMGYWRVTIILNSVEAALLRGGDLYELVSNASVNAHTRFFPRYKRPYISGTSANYANLNSEGNDFLNGEPETWRMFENGVFIFYFGIYPDWVNPDILKERNLSPGKNMNLEDIIVTFSRIIQLALNFITAKKIQSHTVQINVELDGLGERVLYSNNPISFIESWRGYIAGTTRYHYSDQFTTIQLLADANDISIQWAKHFLNNVFQVSLSENILKDIQTLNY